MNSRVNQSWKILASVLVFTVVSWVGGSLWLISSEDLRGFLPPKTFDAQSPDWRFAAGQIEVTDEGIEINAPGPSGEVLVLVNIADPIEINKIGRVVMEYSGAPDTLPSVLWSETPQFQVSGQEEMRQDGQGRAEAVLAFDQKGLNQMYFLGLYSIGLIEPWSIQTLKIHPKKPDFLEFQMMLIDRFLDHQPWRQQDINFSYYQPFGLKLPLLPIVMTWFIFSALIVIFISRPDGLVWRRSVLVLFLLAWVMLDLRWTLELFARGAAQYEESAPLHLSAEQSLDEMDARLMAFSQQLQENLDESEFNRIYALGEDFEAFRLRYHLSAWGVRALVSSQLHPRWVRQLQHNDLVIVVDPWDLEVTEMGSRSDKIPTVQVSYLNGVFSFTGRVVASGYGFWAVKFHRPNRSDKGDAGLSINVR